MQNLFSTFQRPINTLTVETPFGNLLVQSNLLTKEDVSLFTRHFNNVKSEEEFAYVYEKLQEKIVVPEGQKTTENPTNNGFDVFEELTKNIGGFAGMGEFGKVFQQEDVQKQVKDLTKEFGNLFDVHTTIFHTAPNKPTSEPKQQEEVKEEPIKEEPVKEKATETPVEVVKDFVVDIKEEDDIDREIARLKKLKEERLLKAEIKQKESNLQKRRELTLKVNELTAELESEKVNLLNVFDNPLEREDTYQTMLSLDSQIKKLQAEIDSL